MTTSIAPKQTEVIHSPIWQAATWADYENCRDDRNAPERLRLFFHDGFLLVTMMGWEGIKHAEVGDLFVMLFAFWFNFHPEQTAKSLGGCLMEKSGKQAAAPDLVLYLGDNAPTWNKGEPRRIDLDKWAVPDLVGEVSDTTLASDLDEKKRLYEALGVPEYWVIDVKGRQVLAFQLQSNGKYQICETSAALAGLPIALLEQTLDQLAESTNITAAAWFMQTISQLIEPSN
ncbi:MAG: Uma2 family endonuclease [Alkalinema sp. CAN_BIN05]|nr:Uma2 family endonuclease [Alkalinema sp. CAN_BIN05]